MGDKTKVIRYGIGLVLVNQKNKIYLGARKNFVNLAWQLPQGGEHPGEKPEQTLVRETQEELGIDFHKHCHIVTKMPGQTYYDLPSFSTAPFDGQAHTWYLVQYLGKKKDLDQGIEKSQEFRAWRWGSPGVVLRHATNFKRPVYETVLRYFNLLV